MITALLLLCVAYYATAWCWYVCYTYCPGGAYCYRVCYRRCTGKRSLTPQDKGVVEARWPCKFSEYDKDNDGKITRQEFAAAIHVKPKEDPINFLEAFKSADTDKNSTIDCNEFIKAPYRFACEPECA